VLQNGPGHNVVKYGSERSIDPAGCGGLAETAVEREMEERSARSADRFRPHTGAVYAVKPLVWGGG